MTTSDPEEFVARCGHCKKRKGDHRAGDLNCPLGRGKGRYVQFHASQSFCVRTKPGEKKE